MENNEVVLELIKIKKSQQYIMEVIRIESSIDNIIVYQPNNGKGCLISNRPPSIPTDKSSFMKFNYSNLPQNYWKKYELAAKFVKMVRSRTPKITLHVTDAKCILYDTSPDFEAHFHRHGTKFHISGSLGTIKITNTDGTSLSLESNSRSTCLSPDMQEMLENVHKWHNYCIDEEKMREARQEIYTDIVQFPLTIGRRSLISHCLALTNTNTNTKSLVKSSQLMVSRDKSLDTDFEYSKLGQNINNTTNLSNTSTNFSVNFKTDTLSPAYHNLTSNNFNELKSVSSSSLNASSHNSNNNTNNNNNSNSDSMRLNHSYPNNNHPLNQYNSNGM